MFWTIVTVVLIVALLVGANGLYVAGEFSSVSARKTRIIQLAEGGNRLAAMILPVLEDTRRLDTYIAASQVGITLSSIVLGIYGQRQIAELIAPLLAQILPGTAEASGEAAAAGITATLVLIVLTTLQVILGELLPKSIAIQYPEKLALITAIPMKLSADFLLRPLIAILNGSGALLLKALGAEPHGEHAHLHSPQEILILLKESRQGGLIDEDEGQMLRNVFRGRETTAGEIAIPRTQMVAAEAGSSVEEVLRKAAESAYSRIPIYEGDIDHVTGFVHLKDLFKLYREAPSGSIASILRPIPFVPETLPATAVWERLNEAASYLALVFDEFGSTFGLVTREDLLEELFGEFQDEFDEERALITPTGEGRFLVRGDVQIAYLNDLLDIDLPRDTSNTLAGLVLDRLGRVPVGEDIVEVNGIELRVEAVTNHTAQLVRLTLPGNRPGAVEVSG
nr:HlyC/CorC family transporter [Anaerolineae bacterium]